MEQRVISLPPNGMQLHINNRFLPAGATDFLNFQIPPLVNLNASNLNNRAYRLYVHHVYFRNYIPTIRKGVNDTFTYKIDNTTYTDTFAPGVYNVNSLPTAILASLNAKQAGFTSSYNTDQFILTITPPVGHTFYIPNQLTSDATFNIRQYNSGYRFLEMLGFIRNTGTTYTNSVPVIGLDPVNFQPVDFMKINLDNYSCGIINTNPRNPQTIATVPISGSSFGSLIAYSPSMPVAIDIDPFEMNSLRIACTDQEGITIQSATLASTLEIHLMIIPLQ